MCAGIACQSNIHEEWHRDMGPQAFTSLLQQGHSDWIQALTALSAWLIHGCSHHLFFMFFHACMCTCTDVSCLNFPAISVKGADGHAGLQNVPKQCIALYRDGQRREGVQKKE